jgi:hypothetical protein
LFGHGRDRRPFGQVQFFGVQRVHGGSLQVFGTGSNAQNPLLKRSADDFENQVC